MCPSSYRPPAAQLSRPLGAWSNLLNKTKFYYVHRFNCVCIENVHWNQTETNLQNWPQTDLRSSKTSQPSKTTTLFWQQKHRFGPLKKNVHTTKKNHLIHFNGQNHQENRVVSSDIPKSSPFLRKLQVATHVQTHWKKKEGVSEEILLKLFLNFFWHPNSFCSCAGFAMTTAKLLRDTFLIGAAC